MHNNALFEPVSGGSRTCCQGAGPGMALAVTLALRANIVRPAGSEVCRNVSVPVPALGTPDPPENGRRNPST